MRLTPTFPQTKSKRPKDVCDEPIMLERAWQLSGDYDHFKARSAADALKKVIEDLKNRLEHWTTMKAV